jgi:hypothetical protein
VDERDHESPVERRIQRSYEDGEGFGKPLSRRARQGKRSVEAYLKAGVLPRYMERLREIERETDAHLRALERAYGALREECAGDPELFARLWRERAARWRFGRLTDLVREHNEWYPIEASLPMDPRTRDYVRIRGRSYRREEVGPGWVLRRFPPLAGQDALTG